MFSLKIRQALASPGGLFMLICAIDDTYHALLHAADGFLLELKLPHLRLVDDGLQLLPLGG